MRCWIFISHAQANRMVREINGNGRSKSRKRQARQASLGIWPAVFLFLAYLFWVLVGGGAQVVAPPGSRLSRISEETLEGYVQGGPWGGVVVLIKRSYTPSDPAVLRMRRMRWTRCLWP